MKLKQYPPQYVLFLGCSIISVGMKLKFEEELIMMECTHLLLNTGLLGSWTILAVHSEPKNLHPNNLKTKIESVST